MLTLNKAFVTIVFIITVGGCLFAGLTGCASAVSHSSMEFSYSDYDGLATKDISLGTDTDQLSMSGRISVDSGKVRLFVNVKSTGKELYSKEFTSSDNVNIDIDSVGSDKDLVLGLDAEKVKDLHLKLSSEQKLDCDPETPAVPKPGKP